MVSSFIFSVISVFIFVASIGVVNSKPYKLVFLHQSRITGNEPLYPADCRNGAQLAAVVANNRTDILPDYDIQIDEADERAAAANAVKEFMNFTNFFMDNAGRLAAKNVYQAPVMVGPWVSNGCKAIGAFAHHLDYIEISTFCSAAFLSDRAKYPNLFLSQVSINARIYGFVRVMKEIFRFNRCGVVTYVDNVNDYAAAITFQKAATEQGVDVAWFDSIIKFDEVSAQSLKLSDVRLVFTFLTNVTDIVTFYCEAYRAGIRGTRYIFLTTDASMPDPATFPAISIPKFCSRQILFEQVARTFATVGFDGNLDPLQKHAFGYNQPEFDQMFTSFKNGTPPALDFERRFMCHDAASQAIMVLDKTEKRLKAELNLTLRDFVIPSNRHKIGAVMRQEAFAVNYPALHMTRIKYDLGTGELYSGHNFIAVWVPETRRFRRVYVVTRLDNSPALDYNSYTARQIGDLNWGTPNNQPPRDGRVHKAVILQPSLSALILISLFSGILFLVQILSGLFALVKRRGAMRHLVCFGLLGACLLDAAAISFVVETVADNAFVVETVRIVLLVAALTLVNGVSTLSPLSILLALKSSSSARALRNSPSKATKQTSDQDYVTTGNLSTFKSKNALQLSAASTSDFKLSRQQQSVPQLPPSSPAPSLNAGQSSSKASPQSSSIAVLLVKAQQLAWKYLIGYAGVNVYLMTAWFLVHGGFHCTLSQLESAFYDELADVVIQNYLALCFSPIGHRAWIFALACGHVLFLIVGCLFAFRLRRFKSKEIIVISLSVINAMALMVASFFILIILGNDPITQRIAVAVLSLTMSTICSATWLFGIHIAKAEQIQVTMEKPAP